MTVLTEIRHSARRLLASRGYSASALLTLTLGLGLSVGMYTVLNGVLLASLPYPGGERVVEIVSRNTEQNETDGGLTPAEAFALQDVPAFEQAGWYVWGGATVLSGDQPREIIIHNVSGGYFPALGVRPQLGRWITEDDVGPERQAAVLSDAEWERLTARDPDVVGQTLELVDDIVTVVGVMPPDLDAGPVGLWRAANPEWYSSDPSSFGYARYVFAYGRLAEGVDAGRAAAELDAMTARVRDTHGLADHGWRLSTISLLEVAVGDVRGVLVGVFVVSLVVLAIACANVGSLLAARMAARERELAIVQALGATSARVWRGMLLELLSLSVLATAGALLLLVVGLEAFRSLAADILPRADEIRFTPTAFVFASGVALLCPLLVAMPFGFRLRRRMAGNLQASGKGAGGTSRGALRALPVAGLALATTALVAGTAVALSLDRLRDVDPGYRTDNIYAVQLFHDGEPDDWRRFAGAVMTRMASEPDVEEVALTTAPPLSIIGAVSYAVQVPGRAEPEPLQAGLRRVTPGYFDLLEVPLHRGRGFFDTDGAAGAGVAIVNETFARRAFGGLDVVGREIALPLSDEPWVPYRIVGVAADIHNAGLRRPPDPAVIIPFMQAPTVGTTFLVHAPRAGDGLLQRLQEAVWAVDPEEAMTRVYRLQDDIERELEQVIFFTRVLGGFALLAVLLAGFGTYSVIAFLQRRQVREIGVRLALGAEPGVVARRVLAQGVTLAVVAGAAGSVAAVAVLRLLGSQLFGVGAASPLLYVLGIAGVLIAALLASAAPAWRASRVQPMAALRYE
jgi:predicted permease